MAIGKVVDRRPQYATRLRQIADLVEKSQLQPVGLSMQLFWHDQSCTRINKTDDGFNALYAAGIFLRTANEHASAYGDEDQSNVLPPMPEKP